MGSVYGRPFPFSKQQMQIGMCHATTGNPVCTSFVFCA
ncbi:hypothetical protein C7S15_2495 [Burkholderia cepacia]|nr:hypothetical protein [Burkholderia cepacia]